MENGVAVDVSRRLHGRAGGKRIHFDVNKVSEVPLRRRNSIRSLVKAMTVPQTTRFRRIKKGDIRPHMNAVKPYLTEEGKKVRLQFCFSMLEPSSLASEPIFKNMYNYVHIDEKWFLLSREVERYYLLPGEREPLRTCKSKRFIMKVMFLAAVARPRFDAFGNEEFSGKIGTFPFTFKEPAKRSSKNRVAGTLETKAITSITKEIMRSCLIDKVLPAIRAKWPHYDSTETIFIQQDNAKPHIQQLDSEFVQAARKDGFDIRLSFQPPNSLDLNVLDLGYFNSIQSLQHQEAPTTIDELVAAVEKSFENLSFQSLNEVFLSLQACMIEIMKVDGGNHYKQPHLGKNMLMTFLRIFRVIVRL
ncbi:hypothetical protein RHSIM_Rhsim11G0002500 [Rhododendron simsii]|uniref:Transposase n=1 Tax=Rhododendron simsii TaxID=118357 RepID=A0A834L869_RHOSS|nr:hypothetical protein RHSIM_Rhsim11G0002500 [Rhododendron simsii]